MKRLQRAALVADLTDDLRAQGSWAGETHLQKAMFLLQEMLRVPSELEFELYKHGPFSFQFRDELAEMRSEDVLVLESQRPPYGPRFSTGAGTQQLRKKFPKTLRKYQDQLRWIASWMGDRGVVELEKSATAFWVIKDSSEDANLEHRAQRLHELKPHFSIEECREAVTDIDQSRMSAPVVAAAAQ